jgi:prepilin-type N-terminal cleavage/methylation domain-containing protein/prepilin-type processing-associated H-X9-DG protein
MRRHAFTLIELLVVIAILGVLMALLLPAVQKVREAANRARCQNNLRQFGLAMHSYHDAVGNLPPGITTWLNMEDGAHTGFSYMLPYLEQDAVYRQFNFSQQWWKKPNFIAVGYEIPTFYCPSNRTSGSMNLKDPLYAWGGSMPATVGSTDYILCKGANAAVYQNAWAIPLACRGVFNVYADMNNPDYWNREGIATPLVVRLTDITDGATNTFAIGEGAGNSKRFPLRQMEVGGSGSIVVNNCAAENPYTNGPIYPDQAWAAGSIAGPHHPWSTSVFGVTAQYGMAPDYRDEPMNGPLVMPSAYYDDDTDGRPPDGYGYNKRGDCYLSGFRSMHTGGCNFLFCDGSVRFVADSILPATYRALSTYAGGEVTSGSY